MDIALPALAALLASLLTFFTGFGLGTLLLPVFALFMPVVDAVALTALVHLVSGGAKLAFTVRHVEWRIVATFGLPAMIASLAGAWLLLRISGAEPWLRYSLAGHSFAVMPVKLLVGVLLAAFAAAEVIPSLKKITFSPRWMPAGGVLSGFFGGLAGMQGALRSTFLLRADLTKEAFIGTGAALACLIDLTRLGVYARALRYGELDRSMVCAALVAAVAGAVLGSLLLKKVPMRAVERLVAGMLFFAAAGLVTGLI
jgi:uncharacterized membrane protein YfcA